jgi:hypothetical protein
MALPKLRRMNVVVASLLLGMSAAVFAQISDIALKPGFTGDDPSAIRDALARHVPTSGAPKEVGRVKKLIGSVFHRDSPDATLEDAGLARTLAFVVPADHGLHYRSKAHLMLVDVSLADDDTPDAITLKRTVAGPRGRKLVVATEAKAKGFIQNIDEIELDASGGKNQLSVRGKFALARADYDRSAGHVAIVLVCRLVPPYLTETREHTDPTDDEPTDITTRSSVLHASVQDVWVIDQASGKLLAKGLQLAR